MEEAVENLTLEELKEKFLSLLDITKCAVCLESVRQEVVQCVNGHLLCSDCKADLEVCPTCRNSFSQSKPSCFVYQVLEILPTRCKYRNCPTILRNDDDHEKYCGFKPTQCKWCGWEGPGKDFWDHSSYSWCIVESPYVDSSRTFKYFNIDVKLSLFTVLDTFNETLFFWEQVINDPDTKTFTIKWHLVPNGKPTEDFFVTLSFQSESGHSTTTTIKLNIDPDAPSEDNTISVPHRLLFYFIDEDSALNYSVVKSRK